MSTEPSAHVENSKGTSDCIKFDEVPTLVYDKLIRLHDDRFTVSLQFRCAIDYLLMLHRLLAETDFSREDAVKFFSF